MLTPAKMKMRIYMQDKPTFRIKEFRWTLAYIL